MKIIRVIIKGRLGNQMFQYANALELKKEYNDFKMYILFDKIDNQLEAFGLEKDIVYKEYETKDIPIYQRLVLKIYMKIRKIRTNGDREKQQNLDIKYSRILSFFGIRFNTVGYINYPRINRKNILIIGYFESPKYFKKINDSIIEKYRKINVNDEVKKICEKASKEESVAISIRRGDFNDYSYTNVCNNEYYVNAMKVIKDKVKNPKFYIFSDDILWVKENMDFPTDSFYEDSKHSIYDVMKIRMSCKNFILANSTFSWWGGYLSENENKIVVAPLKWRSHNAKIDLVDEKWIKVDNKSKEGI